MTNTENIIETVAEFFRKYSVSSVKINDGWISKPGDQEYTLYSATAIKDRLILEFDNDLITLTRPRGVYTQDDGKEGPLLQVYDFEYGVLERDEFPPGQRIKPIAKGVVEFYGSDK